MLPDIKIAQINTFLTVAHCKNFRKAATVPVSYTHLTLPTIYSV